MQTELCFSFHIKQNKQTKPTTGRDSPRASSMAAVILKQSTVVFYKYIMQVVHDHDEEIKRKKRNKLNPHIIIPSRNKFSDRYATICPSFFSCPCGNVFCQKQLTGERVYSTHSFRLQFIIAMMLQPQELEGAGHIASVTRNRKQ